MFRALNPLDPAKYALLSCFLGIIAATSAAHAQPEEEPETPLDIEAETAEFKQSISKLREHLSEMNRVIVSYSVGDDSEDRIWREKWTALIEEGHAIHKAMVEAALAEYQMDPPAKPEIAEMLFRILRRNCKADRYEGMFEVAKVLVENNYPDPLALNYAVQSAFAANEFDAAKPYFDTLIKRGDASDVLNETSQRLDEYKQLWEEELRLRAEDAQGEPLPRVLIKTTKGDMEVELFENQAPNTVANFIHLVEQGFFDHLDFHRVIEHFMAQTGCPNEDGTGGPGYTIASECDHPDARHFFRGTLGLALGANQQTGVEDPSSGGSQFFVTFLPTHHLNDRYTAFGRVVKGFEVLANIQKIDPDNKEEDKEQAGAASIPDEIVTIEVLHKRDHEYVPQKL